MLDSDGALFGGTTKREVVRVDCELVSGRSFLRMDKKNRSNAIPTNLLSSVGVHIGGALFVPFQFLSQKGVVFGGSPAVRSSAYDLGGVKRGDFLAHRDHGVGECVGLRQVKNKDGSHQEFLMIKYGDGGVVSVDIGCLDIVSYYAPAYSEGVALDVMSRGGSWKRRVVAARKQIDGVVAHLLKLYVKRNDLLRPPSFVDSDLEKEFLQDFPFEDTIDQGSAWKEISSDMSSGSPMDRLLCGDVGFGKTEIAIRAAFRSVLSGSRVVVLAPTTILVNQLYSAFLSRLKPFSVNVEMVSRFRSAKEIVQIKSDIKNGLNDVIVGTHTVLNNSIYHKNIGLLVVDEEHRFGVKHKEKIKELKHKIDVLSMSATPIPRSMNLALTGLYSISMLQSPPRLRLPIITHVEYYNESLIRDAVLFESERGGQIYFIHNNINSIESIAEKIRFWSF